MGKIKIPKDYEILIKHISRKKITQLEDKRSLFKDQYQTEQQVLRDSLITELLEEYIDGFIEKQSDNSSNRKLLKNFSVILISIIIAIIVILVLYIIFFKNIDSWQAFAGVVTALVTLSGSLFGIIQLIAQRAFPVDDEKYITEIVKLIQENDLKHKQENIKAAKDTAMMIVEHGKEEQAVASDETDSNFTPIS